jgi:prepilin-type N-terminal cleavage/methylation domain-containing protein/prepilin-type processing-associated H-X9-DG protein
MCAKMLSAGSGRRNGGFTLIELLVVVGIVGLLMALLMPAVQSARESARATACRNHVGQLTKAVLAHESSQRHFPSGGWGDAWLAVAERGSDARQPGGWTFGILPFLEQATLMEMVAGVTAGDVVARYRELVASPVTLFACPSRRSSSALPLPAGSFRAALDTSVSLSVATRSDYAANAGTSASCPPLTIYRAIASDPAVASKSVQICHANEGKKEGTTQTVSISAMFGNGGHGNHSGDHVGVCSSCSDPVVVNSPASLSEGDSWTRDSVAAKVNRSDGGLPDLQDGLVFRMSALTAGAVRDGMSTTYLLGEKYVAGGLAGAGTDAGDTAPLFVGYSDDNLRWAYDPPLRDERGKSLPQAFGSPHIGGVNMSFADWSVRSIPFEIDPAVHKALAGRNDRIVVSPP